jgi:hypothetical protein
MTPPPTADGAGMGPSGGLHDNRSTLPLGACLRTHTHAVRSTPLRGWWTAELGRAPTAECKGW